MLIVTNLHYTIRFLVDADLMTRFDLCDLLLLCCTSSIDDSDIDTVSVLLSVTRVDVLLLSRDSVNV
jgi:hypothetical protein